MNDIINMQCIKTNAVASDWQDAIRQAGNLLVQAKKIHPSYIRSMIELVQELGPYIVIIPHVAIAHARPKGNVYHAGISIVKFQNDITFHSINDPVNIVICIATLSGKQHLRMLQELTKLLEEDMLNRLKHCNSNEEVYQLFSSCDARIGRKEVKEE